MGKRFVTLGKVAIVNVLLVLLEESLSTGTIITLYDDEMLNVCMLTPILCSRTHDITEPERRLMVF